MNLLRRFHLYAYLLAILAVLAFSIAEFNPPLLLVCAVVIGLSWWLVETPNARPLPRWLINMGVLFSSMLLFAELVLWRQDNLLLALGHFMIAIMLCKLFESKSDRDYAQILTLTLLVVVTASINSSTIVFGLILAAYLGVGLYTLLLFHLHGESLRAAVAPEVAASIPATPTAAAVLDDRRVTRDVRYVAYVSGLFLVLFGAVTFTLFPRNKSNQVLAGWSLQSSAPITGLSDRVTFGSIRQLQQSDAIVMHVTLSQHGVNAGAEYYQPYFRAMTFDTYDPVGHQWLRSRTIDGRVPAIAEIPPTPAGDMAEFAIPQTRDEKTGAPLYSANGMLTQTYDIRMPMQNVLFTLQQPATAAILPPVAVRSKSIRSIITYPRDLAMAYRGASGELTYEVDSPLMYKPGIYPAPDPIAPGMLGHLDMEDTSTDVQVPPQIPEIAREILGDLMPSPGQRPTSEQVSRIASRLETYLRETYPYTLNTRDVDRSLDPTVDFLKNRRQIGAHCEYFASAMVMLCSAAGVPSRVATGFHGGEYNSVGGFYVVRQKFAHAWVEVYVPNRGWILYDPTPSGSEDTAASSDSWLRWIREIYEVVERNWLSGIVSFDNSTRHYLASILRGNLQTLTPVVRRWITCSQDSVLAVFAPTTPWSLRLTSFSSLALALAGVLYLIHTWRRRSFSYVYRVIRNMDRATQRRLAADLAFFDDLLWMLRPLGIRRHSHQTPREYIERIGQTRAALATPARFLVATFYDLRFGTVSMTPELRRQVAAALQAVRTALHQPA